jgi:hypothetical protein
MIGKLALGRNSFINKGYFSGLRVAMVEGVCGANVGNLTTAMLA